MGPTKKQQQTAKTSVTADKAKKTLPKFGETFTVDNLKALMSEIQSESTKPPVSATANATAFENAAIAASVAAEAADHVNKKYVSVNATVQAMVECPKTVTMLPLGIKKDAKEPKLLDKSAYPDEWYAITARREYTDTFAMFKDERDYVVKALKHSAMSFLVITGAKIPTILFKNIRAAMPAGRAESRCRLVDTDRLRVRKAVNTTTAAAAAAATTVDALPIALDPANGDVQNELPLYQWQLAEAVAVQAVGAGLIPNDAFQQRTKLLSKPESFVQLVCECNAEQIHSIVLLAKSYATVAYSFFPMENIVSSAARSLQMTIKQKFYDGGSTRDECVLHALKLASEFCNGPACCYANGTNVRAIVQTPELKVQLKDHLRQHAKWAGFLPEDETKQFEEDVYSAWSNPIGSGHVASPQGVDTGADLLPIAGLKPNEEMVVIRSLTPLPKNIDTILGAVKELTFLAKRGSNSKFCFCKAPKGFVPEGNLREFSLAGKPLYAQRLSEWTAENV